MGTDPTNRCVHSPSLVTPNDRVRLLSFVACFALSVAAAQSLAQVSVSEIQYDPIGLDNGRQWVELMNAGPLAVDLTGYWLSFPPASFRFPNNTLIPPGGTLVVHLNRTGIDGETAVYTGIAGVRNLRWEDSLALFSKNLFNDPSSIVDYVQWSLPGSPPQAGEEVAVAAGIWFSGDRVDIGDHRPGCSLAYDGDGDLSSDWCVNGVPSQGEANGACVGPTVISFLRLSEIGAVRLSPQKTETQVELMMAGEEAVLEDIGGYHLATGQSFYQFPVGTFVHPGQVLLVHLGETGVDDEDNIYTGPGFTGADLAAPGSLALFGDSDFNDATWMIDFVQWGAPGQTFEATAQEAGLWDTGTAVDTAGRVGEGTLASLAGEEKGLQRWYLDNTPTLGSANSTPPETDLVINEVVVEPKGAGSQAIELYNRGQETLVLSSHVICVAPRVDTDSCYTIPPDVEIEPGGYLVIWISGGAPVENNLFTGPFPNLDPDGDAVALILSLDTQNPGNFLDFLEWGSGGGELETLAVAGGLWQAGESIDTGNLSQGSSIAYLGSGRGPSQYRIDTSPSPGQSNPEGGGGVPFIRADCGANGSIDLGDATLLLQSLFLGAEVPCEDACDFDDDGSPQLNDAIASLSYQFLGSAPPAPPFPDCSDEDPNPDALGCESFPPCQ